MGSFITSMMGETAHATLPVPLVTNAEFVSQHIQSVCDAESISAMCWNIKTFVIGWASGGGRFTFEIITKMNSDSDIQSLPLVRSHFVSEHNHLPLVYRPCPLPRITGTIRYLWKLGFVLAGSSEILDTLDRHCTVGSAAQQTALFPFCLFVFPHKLIFGTKNCKHPQAQTQNEAKAQKNRASLSNLSVK